MSQLQAEDFLMVPTPPSASSSTSAPPLPWAPRQPTSPVKPQPKILPTVAVPQADDGCKRKLWDYSRCMSMISCPAGYTASGSLPLASPRPDMRLLPASHTGESVCLLRSATVLYSTGRTVISANPPAPAPAPAPATSRSWLSL